jgi:hypothetical protein
LGGGEIPRPFKNREVQKVIPIERYNKALEKIRDIIDDNEGVQEYEYFCNFTQEILDEVISILRGGEICHHKIEDIFSNGDHSMKVCSCGSYFDKDGNYIWMEKVYD